MLPALYDARFSPANPALPDPHLVEVLVQLASSTCQLPVAFPIALPQQHSNQSQSSQALGASSLPIPSTLLSTSGLSHLQDSCAVPVSVLSFWH